jgi:membrane protein YqaA with SNARE-associated domain
MEGWLQTILGVLALPEVGLSTVFVISLLSATLLPMASIPAVYGLIQLNPALFWPALLVATAGNTTGGAITYWMGYAAERAYERLAERKGRKVRSAHELRALGWLQRWGPPGCLLAWLPIIGDPICGVAGWLQLPFWRCVAWMAIGKFARYLTYTVGLVWAFPFGF